MEYRYLGKTGLRVSELCLGTMPFGAQTDDADSAKIMDAFVAAGGTFIDTADAYTRGESERVIGRWLAGQQRDQLILATKGFFPIADGLNDRGLSRKHLIEAVDGSLRRLQTDYIDLYQVHCWDSRTPFEETFSTLDRLVSSGKIRYVGLSNFTGWQLQKAIDLTRQLGWESPVSLQPMYSLLCRTTEWELLEVCRNEGLGVICWSPLHAGWLSGNYRRGMDAPPAGSRIERSPTRMESWDNTATEATWRVLDAVEQVSNETGKTFTQVALNWVLRQPGVTGPILGARTLEHLQDNLGATDWALSDAQVAALNAASALTPPYPYEFVYKVQRP